MKSLFCALALSFAFLSPAFAMDANAPATNEVKSNSDDMQSSGAIKKSKTTAVSTSDLKKADQDEETPEHLFGLHAALGFPHPISFGLNYVHSSHYFSAEVSTGEFGTTISDIKTKIQNYELALRWHPFAGSFYVGALLGNQKITAEKVETIDLQTVHGHAEVTSNYITPAFGWMWGAQSTGFFASMEFGYQSPSNVKTEFNTDANALEQTSQQYQDLQKDVKDKSNDIGKMGLPHVVLLKVGWLF